MDAKFIHENLFLKILIHFERSERIFLSALVINDLNFAY